jgi:hypothetical protein
MTDDFAPPPVMTDPDFIAFFQVIMAVQHKTSGPMSEMEQAYPHWLALPEHERRDAGDVSRRVLYWIAQGDSPQEAIQRVTGKAML